MMPAIPDQAPYKLYALEHSRMPSCTYQDSGTAPALAQADERRFHFHLEVIDHLHDATGTVNPM